MSQEAELTALRTVFETNLSDPENMRWPGDTTKPPAISSTAQWYDVDLDYSASDYVTFQWERRQFVIDVACCVQPGPAADKKARQMCDNVVAALRGNSTSNLVFRVGEARPGNQGPWQGWYRREIIIPAWWTESGGTSMSATSTQILVSQAAHGFVAGDWLSNAAGTYAKAGSDEAEGVVVTVPSAGEFMLGVSGPQTIPSHGLTVGAPFFLHPSTDGAATSTEPSPGERFQRLGTVHDSNTLIVRVGAKVA